MASARPRFDPVPFNGVSIEDAFWAPRIRTNRERTIPHVFRMLEETGRADAFRWKAGSGDPPHVFFDSDVAKWMEAAACSLALHPDPALESRLEDLITAMEKAQEPDGYLNSHYIAVERDQRWTNLRDRHELYCAGHLIEAAVAHKAATGKRRFLDLVCRYADHIDRTFGPGKRDGYPGHEEIELALVKLYRATGERRYLDLGRYFVDRRGRQPHFYDAEARARGEDPETFRFRTYDYNQSHRPVREQDIVVGHAVRAMYLYSAMADLAGELGDRELLRACERLWEDLSLRKMYVTGGAGPSARNEGFTRDYDLPNLEAYAETCAAIALVFWARRMLRFDCDRRYADVMERALYNGVLSGVSLDGVKFFYVNPLASRGDHHRREWFGCACCPTNLVRVLASVGGCAYSRSETDAAVHLYVQGSGRFDIAGRPVTVHQQTNYPWDGKVRIRLELERPAAFGLRLRIPGWCRDAHLRVAGRTVPLSRLMENGYARIQREWRNGDPVALDLPMPVERVRAHPDVRHDVGKVALQRGPVVYCLEQADNEEPVNRLLLPADAGISARFRPDLLGGVVVLSSKGRVLIDDGWEGALYRVEPPPTKPCRVMAVPYCVWDNRDAGPMAVWVPAESA